MVKMVGTVLCGIALSASAADIAFNSPVSWGTVRSSELTTKFIVDSSLIGSPIKLTLTSNVDGKEKVVSSKSITLESVNNEYTFAVSKPVPGGSDYHAIKWEVADQSGEIAPFGMAPVSNSIDPNALVAAQTSDEVTSKTYKSIKGISPITLGENEVSFAWTPKSLSYIVAGSGKVTLSLDPSNSKGSFVAYANRSVTIDFDKNSVKYNYNTRKVSKNEIVFTEKKWDGEMSETVENGVAIVNIPWYELGSKPFAGRQLGVVVTSGESLAPNSAIELAPATWGNLILK